MEFLKANYLNTTTQLTVNSNTASAGNVFVRDPFYQYSSSGLADDLTSSVMTITFASAVNVSRMALQDTNFKEFYFFYNGVTANSFALTAADTTTSSYTGNADTDKYFRFATTACTSITIVAKKTITANDEKLLGMLTISDVQVTLEKIPSADAYKPKVTPKQVVHTLSDGGTRLHTVRQKWEASFNLKYITTAQRDALYDLHYAASEFNFCPFGTATGWDAILFEAVWPGPFDFYTYSDNAQASGFSGKVTAKETSV